MRRSTDLCLLCKINPASKRNSHIYPKFLSTNFLGSNRKGFDLSSDKILNQKPKIIQDSPKEDYILCDECEAYFSVLEGIASDTFINWQSKIKTGDFSALSIVNDLDILECKTADKKTIYLFTYSIFWRVSISSLDIFENVKIAQDFEEEIREMLVTYRNSKKTDFFTALTNNPILKIYPVSIITAKSFTEETANILFVPFSYDPYCIICDRFSFMLFRTSAEIKAGFIKMFSNIQINDCRMMIFSEKLWYNTILKKPYELLADQAIKNKSQSP